MSESRFLRSLKPLLRFEQFIGPVNVKVNGKRNKMELLPVQYALSIVIIVLTNCAIFYEWQKSDGEEFSVSDRPLDVMLSFIIGLTYSFRHILLFYVCIFDRNKVIKNWNDILIFAASYRALNLKCIVYNKLTLLVILIPGIANYASMVFFTLSKSEMSELTLTITYLVGAVSKFTSTAQTFKFLTLITMYRHYFKQLNQMARMIVKNPSANSLPTLKLIVASHQHLHRLTVSTTNTLFLQILLIFSECIVFLTMFVYQFITDIRNSQYSNALECLPVVEFVFIIVYHILPCELCRKEVIN